MTTNLTSSYIKVSNTFSNNPDDKSNKYIAEIKRLNTENQELSSEVLTLHEGYNMMKMKLNWQENSSVSMNKIPNFTKPNHHSITDQYPHTQSTQNTQHLHSNFGTHQTQTQFLSPDKSKHSPTKSKDQNAIDKSKTQLNSASKGVHQDQPLHLHSEPSKPLEPQMRLCTLEFEALAPMIALYKERISNLLDEVIFVK